MACENSSKETAWPTILKKTCKLVPLGSMAFMSRPRQIAISIANEIRIGFLCACWNLLAMMKIETWEILATFVSF